MSLEFAAIADDLTGAVELASILVRNGAPARLLTRRARPEDAAGVPALVIGLRIRTVPAKRAVAETGRALDLIRPLKPRRLFYKYCATFDSTPRGNIGPVADRLMAETGAGFTGFCPAFPEVDRTVYRGHLFVGDMLVSRSPKRFDPLTPMREPDLVTVLGRQTAVPVGLVRSLDLAAGSEGVATRVVALRAQGIGYAIFDTVAEADLEVLARATADWPLMTGGSSIAAHYPALWGLSAPPAPLPKPAGPGAVLAGSCAERTEAQLEAFGRRHPVLRLDPEQLMQDDTAVAEALDWAVARLAGGPVAIATTNPPAEVARLQARFGRHRLARRIERALGRIAGGLHAAGVRHFVIAGGETSGAVLDALRVSALDVGPYEAPGIARAASRGGDPVLFHLKSGKLGPVDMFAAAFAAGK
jgi:3-dehydrotetronate 4-kinase